MGSPLRSCLSSLFGTLAVTGLGLCFWAWAVDVPGPEPGPGSPPQPASAQGLGEGAEPGRAGGSVPPHPPLAPSRPERIGIPALRVDAPLTGLGLEPRGRLASPPEDRDDLAGWYRRGVTPGENGTALIAGHVDTPAGPGVFYDLGALRKGHTLHVRRADGRTAVFVVYAVEVFEGEKFPDRKVYGPASAPELRVITCGGGFDRARQEYTGNVVVFAVLTATA
ncbi:class F sortase [Streptomyces sp. HNM0574]|uniref:class F sortase n=1 Tax=Streptomyces sp. HNM0574 TaxID=2714954 RepID=UPI00146D3E97|nr:class F sortase [Streptomyces sp. HNM0574]NLU70175.1 class F sortase [Streptomyces sp. HNM0574]